MFACIPCRGRSGHGGASRAIAHWKSRETMTEADVECILLRAREQYPYEKPRVFSDSRNQLVDNRLKEFIRFTGMTYSG